MGWRGGGGCGGPTWFRCFLKVFLSGGGGGSGGGGDGLRIEGGCGRRNGGERRESMGGGERRQRLGAGHAISTWVATACGVETVAAEAETPVENGGCGLRRRALHCSRLHVLTRWTRWGDLLRGRCLWISMLPAEIDLCFSLIYTHPLQALDLELYTPTAAASARQPLPYSCNPP